MNFSGKLLLTPECEQKQHVNFPVKPSPIEHKKIMEKSRKFVARWIKTWLEFGLLVQKGEDVSRHSYLDKELKRYRGKWIAGPQNGRMSAIELQPGKLPTHKNAALKRVTTISQGQWVDADEL